MKPLLIAVLAAAPIGLYAQTPTIFGTPSNFDVLNDTGGDVHGFEVQLDGIQPQDLGGVWQSSRYPYQILTTPTGIVIHYASPYVGGNFTITTIAPTIFTPTGGHSCVVGMVPGCEHFGYYFGYNSRMPTRTINRWLVADPQNPGALIPYAGPNVQVPVPV